MRGVGRSAQHALRYFLGLDEAATQTTTAERQCLAQYASGKRRIVEIGVFEGVGTRILANCVAPGGRVYGIDPFVKGRFGISWGKMIAQAEIRKSESPAAVELVQAWSWDAAKWLEGTFDMVFIDGDHSLQGIQRDWLDWSPRIVEDGVIALHDTRVPTHNPYIGELGSFKFFELHIRQDPRFVVCEQIDSLSVLRRSDWRRAE